MIYNDAKKIMRCAAVFCIAGPMTIGVLWALRAFDKPYAMEDLRLCLPIGAIIFGLTSSTFYWVKIGSYLWKGKRPELMQSAISCGGSILFFLPTAIGSFDTWWHIGLSLIWLPLWGATFWMLIQLARIAESELAKVIRQEKSPDQISACGMPSAKTHQPQRGELSQPGAKPHRRQVKVSKAEDC